MASVLRWESCVTTTDEAAGEESTGIIGLLGFLHKTTMNRTAGSQRTMNLHRANAEIVMERSSEA